MNLSLVAGMLRVGYTEGCHPPVGNGKPTETVGVITHICLPTSMSLRPDRGWFCLPTCILA